MDLGEIGWGVVDWIGLALDRDKREAVVNAIVNLRFNKLLGHYGVATQLVVSRVVISSIEYYRVLFIAF
jgi:hypothetical protein